jgi:sugar lactone lactonase YvrE
MRGALDRRTFLEGLVAAAALGATGAPAAADAPGAPVTIGSGEATYTLVPGWGAVPGMNYAWGCAVVVDSQDRVYVHSRSFRSVLVFSPDGKLLNSWGAEFWGTGHGLYHAREGSDEYLWFTDHPRNLVVKTRLDGTPVLRIGNVKSESATSIQFTFDQPTDLAIAPTGDIYVCEGYGGNKVHQFRHDGTFVRTIGKPGKGDGEFSTPHGIWVDTRRAEPELLVADRTNGRIQIFDLEGKLKRILKDSVRNPCCFYPYGDRMFVPDLASRVTILDVDDRVVAQLGDGAEVKNDTNFVAPHALTVDSKGDLYVVEWVPDARLRKFSHTPNRA